eukprot:scaffold11487_cov172-Skeletonema_dohrnii-CCMP3373.AAC.1
MELCAGSCWLLPRPRQEKAMKNTKWKRCVIESLMRRLAMYYIRSIVQPEVEVRLKQYCITDELVALALIAVDFPLASFLIYSFDIESV